MAEPKTYGVLAEFDSASTLFHGCEKIRDAGFKAWDAHAPFAVHGLDKAMGLSRSRLPWVVFVCAMLGAAGGMTLQWWTATIGYPLVISGKPLFSWPAFIPVTFELGILFGSLGALFGMFHFNKLPRWNHPLFNSERFVQKANDDGFFVSIEATDRNYKGPETQAWLRSIGATHVEVVVEDDE